MRKVVALTSAELRLLLRNKTAAVTAVGLPIVLGVFWAFTIGGGRDGTPIQAALVVTLQLAVVLSMGIYVTSTVAIVTRRHTKVLKRMRTTGLSDTGLLTATVLPSVIVALGQLVLFAIVDALMGLPAPSNPLPLVLAVLGGVALTVTAALATTIVTANPERAQITTLPLTFVMLGAGVAMVTVPPDGWWRLLVALPGAAISELTRLAYLGGLWEAESGLRAVLPALVALIAWPAVFARATQRRFRWDDRG